MRAATLDFLAEHRSTRTQALADHLVDTIERANPGYRAAGVVPRDDLWRSCHDNICRVLELLADAVADGGIAGRHDDDEAYDAARETGRRRADQGLPLDDVLRSFRIGGRLIWDDLVEQGHARLDALEVREIGTRLWEVVDETSAQVATAYHLHERALVRADEQQRAELWEGVLSGRAREPGFAHDASRLLDLPVAADFVVVVATRLDVARAESRLSPHATAWTRRTGDVVGLVALRDDSPAEVHAALERVARDEGLPLGSSLPAAGLAGVDEAYRQATLALRAQGSTQGLATFGARLPEVLLLGSQEVAGHLVGRWLGPVLDLGEGESSILLDTLLAWVTTGGSATRTAAEVHCHRNTVVNRLRRVSDLTGHRLADGGVPPVELDLALRAWRMGVRR